MDISSGGNAPLKSPVVATLGRVRLGDGSGVVHCVELSEHIPSIMHVVFKINHGHPSTVDIPGYRFPVDKTKTNNRATGESHTRSLNSLCKPPNPLA